MKKFLKKAEGFTLVELIVVIAILGILAGVAIPAYSGYMKKANDAAVVTELDAIATAAQAANATAGEVGQIVVSSATAATVKGTATVSGSNTTYAAVASSFEADFETYYQGSSVTVTDGVATVTLPAISNWANSSYNGKTATWTGAGWTVS